jgi:hemolysin activation/secretion protein
MISLSRILLLTLACSILCPAASFATIQEVSYNSTQPTSSSFKFRRLIIADTEVKVLNLRFPSKEGTLLIMDIPALNTQAFNDLVKTFVNKPINSEFISTISTAIKHYLISNRQDRPTVIIPAQNVATGDLRLVVVVGKYSLAQLKLLSPDRLHATANEPITAPAQAEGQIVLDGVPPLFATTEIGHVLAPFFAKPITGQAVNDLVLALSDYATKHSTYLASVEIPPQNVESGVIKIGLKVGVFPLKHIIVTDSIADSIAYKADPGAGPVVAFKNPLFSTQEFQNFILKKYYGKPISVNLVSEIRTQLVLYGKKHDRLLVDTTTPVIDLERGEVRIGVLIGHYSQLHLKGNKWFTDNLLEKRLGIKPGDEVKASELNDAVNWANQNPFRQVQVVIDTINKPTGIADLDIDVHEVVPVKFAASFSNAINSPLGNSSYIASAQFGNLWGLDHELNYQYSTNNTPKYDQSHSVDYKMPLLWHDYLRTDFSYSLVYPQALFGYKGLNEKAKNTIADMRYIKPITRGIWSYEFSGGLDYKQVNTNLLFGELVQPIATYDIAEIVLGTTLRRQDTHGSWSVAANVFLSPGGFNSRNTENTYENAASGNLTGRSARYEYGKIVIERITNLPWWGMQLASRAQAQISSTNLEGSEQFIVGGGATVRGYSQTYDGDQGFVINQELRSRYFSTHLPFTRSKKTQLNTQFVTFLDYGKAAYKHPQASDITLPAIMGTGFGIRSSLAGHFNAGTDLSFPIITPTYSEPHPSKGSFWISLAY